MQESIYTYLDYRDYLKAFYDYRKSESSLFSYTVFGRMVKMDPSLLAKVLMKMRHISDGNIASFASACKLNEKETEYFENLVHFAKAKTEKHSKVLFEKLLLGKSVSSRQLADDQYEFYRKWYYSAIRALLEYFEFYDDYKKLAEHLNPKITIKEAKDAIALLKKLELIVDNGNGRWIPSDKSLTTGEKWHSLAIHSFQQETIALAAQSFENHPKCDVDISTITMAVSKDDIDEIKERIKEFRKSIMQYVNASSNPTRVYHLNLQLIPLTAFGGKHHE